jgi:hypothetical protein
MAGGAPVSLSVVLGAGSGRVEPSPVLWRRRGNAVVGGAMASCG